MLIAKFLNLNVWGRFELLSMVKKHSNLLGKTTVDEHDASDVQMDGQFWHDVFNLYFVRGRESRGRQDDDLIFFVRKWVSKSGSLLVISILFFNIGKLS